MAYNGIAGDTKLKHTLTRSYRLLAMNDCKCMYCGKNIVEELGYDFAFDQLIKPPIMGSWKMKDGHYGHALFCNSGCHRRFLAKRKQS